MTNPALRLPPSGPVFKNGNGVPVVMGPGAMLRLVEARTTCSAGNVIPTVPDVIGNPIGTAGFLLAFDKPSPGLQYRATLKCDVLNPTTNAAAAVELYLEYSADGATGWTLAASNSHVVGAGPVATSAGRHIEIDMPLGFGSALGVVAGQANLFLRARIGASVLGGQVQLVSPVTPGGNPGSVGAVDMTFSEHV